MASLKETLEALVRDADAIAREAMGLFGSGNAGFEAGSNPAKGEGGSILAIVATEVDRALELLQHYCRSDERLRERVVEVSHGFDAMGRDVLAIRSIDTDMRLMGLNTTLKCARLGSEGRGLGVVAQELRACSRRTEDVSKAIAEAIQAATRGASALDLRSGRDHRAARELADEMSGSMECLKRLHADQMRSLSALTGDCLEVSRLLTGTIDRLGIEQRLAAASLRFAHRMEAASRSGDIHAPGIAEDLHRLFATLYTADLERNTHAQLFGSACVQQSGEQRDSIDDFFF
ncbi:methyl-accepting chemotaxis protein [Azospirillum sp. B506]|uniref:methyl-accepting chemotaxis protein n=1 Tax=Azospirillum sp. B506 TaxID=137721 RepID=UPI000348CE84|nr:methyl-accepting chemotaxis protein [Azospirillum sp. B506]